MGRQIQLQPSIRIYHRFLQQEDDVRQGDVWCVSHQCSLGHGDRAGPHCHLSAARCFPCQCRVLGAASFRGEIASAWESEMRYDPCACSTWGMAVLPCKASVWYLTVERWRIHSHCQPVLCNHSSAHTKPVSLQYPLSLCFHSFCNKFGSPNKPSLAGYKEKKW